MWPDLTTQPAQLLVVDDEPNIRQPIARALNLQGYTVQEASGGLEALTLLERTPFDLMILDMSMADLDGSVVMEQARQLYPNLLILVLTGHPTVDNAVAAVRSEVADYLRKPVSVHEIICTVARILQKNAHRLHRERMITTMTKMLEALQRVEAAPLPEPPAPEPVPEHVWHAPPLRLNSQLQQVTLGVAQPVEIALTKGETAVLAAFMSRPNYIFPCRELVYLAWNYEADEIEAESLIRPYIFRLRRKLEPDSPKPRLIRTIRNRGYMLQTNL